MGDDKKMAWKKLLSVFGVFFLIMAVWQIVVLELLKNGVIGTMVLCCNSNHFRVSVCINQDTFGCFQTAYGRRHRGRRFRWCCREGK